MYCGSKDRGVFNDTKWADILRRALNGPWNA